MRRHPLLYELNTMQFLGRMSQKYGQRVILNSVPDDEWESVASWGFDLVWLMGVWARSPVGREIALQHPGLQLEYARALPGWREEDVAGSPYAVYSYTVDPALGTRQELALLRSKLNRLGMGLVLDFVPNHLAMDNPLVASHPEWFVRGNESDARQHPDWFFSTGRTRVAHGRDPYFPPWTDTAQVNFFEPKMREALAQELGRIAEVADGVRCDMAMLGLNSVFEGVWGGLVQNSPAVQQEFWEMAIHQVKRRHPGFLMMAEAYWGLGPKLLELGFDFAYDKELYDKLRTGTADDVLRQANKEPDYQGRMVRFLENHDEPRALEAFGRERSLAAAAVVATLPGMRFFHDGQLQGFRTRVPVQLARGPGEATDKTVEGFYRELMDLVGRPVFHEGVWTAGQPGHPHAGAGNEGLLSWSWEDRVEQVEVVVNYSPRPTTGCVPVASQAANLRSLRTVAGAPKDWRPGPQGPGTALMRFGPWEAVVVESGVGPPGDR